MNRKNQGILLPTYVLKEDKVKIQKAVARLFAEDKLESPNMSKFVRKAIQEALIARGVDFGMSIDIIHPNIKKVGDE